MLGETCTGNRETADKFYIRLWLDTHNKNIGFQYIPDLSPFSFARWRIGAILVNASPSVTAYSYASLTSREKRPLPQKPPQWRINSDGAIAPL